MLGIRRRTSNHDFLGFTLKLSARDHTRCHGTPTQWVQPLPNFVEIIDPIAIGIFCSNRCSDDKLGEVLETVVVTIAARHWCQDNARHIELQPAWGRDEVAVAPAIRVEIEDMLAVGRAGRQEDSFRA